MEDDQLDARPSHLLVVAIDVEAFRKRGASPIGGADPTTNDNRVEAGLRAPVVRSETDDIKR